jgi:hypothetical protein
VRLPTVARNAVARRVPDPSGEIRDRSFENQRCHASGIKWAAAAGCVRSRVIAKKSRDEDLTVNVAKGSINQQSFSLIEERLLSELPGSRLSALRRLVRPGGAP